MTAVAMSHAPRDRIGLASGVFNASRPTGGALGVAVLGALLTGDSGYVSLHAAFFATAGAYVGGIALALAGRRRTCRITRVRKNAEPATARPTDAALLTVAGDDHLCPVGARRRRSPGRRG